MESFWKVNLAWSLRDATQLYGGEKILLLSLTFIITAIMIRRRRKDGASKRYMDDAEWGLLAAMAVAVLIFLSHLFVFTPENIYKEQRAAIRSLETNILELETGMRPNKSVGHKNAGEQGIRGAN